MKEKIIYLDNYKKEQIDMALSKLSTTKALSVSVLYAIIPFNSH